MPSRDDYAMVCYGAWIEFDSYKEANVWVDETLCKDHVCREGDLCNDNLWDHQITHVINNKPRVYIFLRETKTTVGSRTGTFQTKINNLQSYDLPKVVRIGDDEFGCDWHLVMWGP